MKYYITYNLKTDSNLHIIGPLDAFSYIDEALNIIGQDGVCNLDFVNEAAMNFYFAWQDVENEYEEAKQELIANPPVDNSYTVEDQVKFTRMLYNLQKNCLMLKIH